MIEMTEASELGGEIIDAATDVIHCVKGTSTVLGHAGCRNLVERSPDTGQTESVGLSTVLFGLV